MLMDLNSFDEFFNEVFSRCPIKVSVKTRMGMDSTEEFNDILELYNKYPLSKVIVHARDRAGKYQSIPDVGKFIECFPNSKNPMVYNGDIFSPQHLSKLCAKLPGLDSVMLGRGAICDPSLPRQLKGGAALAPEEMKEFHNRLMAACVEIGLTEHFTMGRMKEVWYYTSHMYPECKKAIKRIYKSKNLDEYKAAAADFFASETLDNKSYFKMVD